MADFWQAVEALGGGLAAMVLIALAFISWRLYGELSKAKDDRLSDAKEYSRGLRESLKETHAAWAASEKTMRETLQEMRRRQ